MFGGGNGRRRSGADGCCREAGRAVAVLCLEVPAGPHRQDVAFVRYGPWQRVRISITRTDVESLAEGAILGRILPANLA